MICIERITTEMKFDAQSINCLLAQQSPGETQREISEEELRESLNNPLFYLFTAVDTESNAPYKYVGMATVFFQRNLARWIAEIHDVVVDKEQRRRGIGELLTKRLMDTALEFSKERNIKIKLYLTSRPSRIAANTLYKKLGFVLVSKSFGGWGTNLYKIIVEPTGFRGLSK